MVRASYPALMLYLMKCAMGSEYVLFCHPYYRPFWGVVQGIEGTGMSETFDDDPKVENKLAVIRQHLLCNIPPCKIADRYCTGQMSISPSIW